MEPRTYAIRTFGCQMNEHDSVRIAGLLEADGLAEADERRRRRRRRPQHLLHPGERRQQALRHPRPPEVAKGAPARARDRGRRLPGPEGPRPRSASGRRTSTWCSAPTTCTGPPSCSTRPATGGPGHRDPRGDRRRRPRAFPSALAARARARLRRRGSRSRSAATTRCAFCIVPAVRGPEISRPFDELVAEVRAAGRRRRHRGHPARPERELLRARPGAGPAASGRATCGCGRCSPTCCGPSARSTASSGCATPARTRRTSAPRRSRRWPTTPAVCEHLHLPLQSGSDRVLAAMHRGYTAERYLERLAAARAGVRRPGRHHRHHRRLPRRDRRRLRAHPRGGRRGRLRQRLHVHLLAPAGHRGGRAGRRVRPGRGRRRAVRAADRGRRALAPASATRPASGAPRRSWSRAAASATPADATGRTRQNKLVHFPARAACGPAPTPRSRVTGAGAAPPAGRARRAHRAGPAPHPHRGHGRAVTPRHGDVVRPSRRRRRSWRRPGSVCSTSSARASASWPRSGPTAARASTRSARWWPTASCGRSSSGSRRSAATSSATVATRSTPSRPSRRTTSSSSPAASDGSTTPRPGRG